MMNRRLTLSSIFSVCLLLLSSTAVLAAKPEPTAAPQALTKRAQVRVPSHQRDRRQEASPQESLVATTVVLDGTLTTMTIQPSPTAGVDCVLHEGHWDCASYTSEAAAAEAEEAHDDHDHDDHGSESGSSHAGHGHGPSELYGCGLAPLDEYNLGLHIGAIFILLLISAIGVFLPMLVRAGANHEGTSLPRRILNEVFFALKHAGYGTILSVCFVHLLIHALIYLSNECVQPLAYEATPAAITMAGVLFVFLFDFFMLRRVRRQALAAESRNLYATSNPPTPTEKDAVLEDESQLADEAPATNDLSHAKAKVQSYELLIFELSILLHSVIIGVTLGAQTGSGWSTLLIAVAFHQLFEGLALGARIASVPRQAAGTLKRLTLATIFALITPIGIAIGVGARTSFNPNDRSTLLAMGTLQSLSAGALLWSVLVELIAADYIYGAMARASLGRAVAGVTAMLVGALLMAVLAQWA